MDDNQNIKPDKSLFDTTPVKYIRAQLAPKYLDLSFFFLVWIFVLASFLGLIIEDIFHALVYGGWESRAGLVWGPFSPVYGCGAVLLTLFLNRFYYTHNLIVFFIAMLIGSVLEYGTSWMMEVFWHAIAWDYTGTFGSIDGRTNFVFGVMWGTLGLFWVRLVMPTLKKMRKLIDFKNTAVRIATIAIIAFMTVDIAVTVLALHREGQRAYDIPPTTEIDVLLDEHFPDEWLHERFHNMTVSQEVGKD